jgi:hypothetical protein
MIDPDDDLEKRMILLLVMVMVHPKFHEAPALLLKSESLWLCPWHELGPEFRSINTSCVYKINASH